MATKRRRVWVVVDESGGLWGATQHGTEARSAAAKFEADGHDRRVVPFTERLPGDVVLSREESERVRQFVLGSESRSVSTAEDEVLALLRGRR